MATETLVPPGAPFLRVEGLTKVYRSKGSGRSEVRANDGLNLAVHPGELLAILGPNGAGKSTLLRQLAGQLIPTSGSVSVGGVDLVASPLRAKQLLSAIPQECQPIDNLTVEEHVRYFAEIKGIASRDAARFTEELLANLGLGEHRTKLVRELSGGLKRRVLIAVALASHEARLLLLDEPTTGLDPEGRRTVWAVVEGLKRRGMAIVLTTHYTEEADRLADRIAILNHGRFVAQGTPREIVGLSGAKGRIEVWGLDRATVEAHAILDSVVARAPIRFRKDDHVRLEVVNPFAPETVQDLARLAGAGFRASLAPVSLEDAYLAFVGSEANGG